VDRRVAAPDVAALALVDELEVLKLHGALRYQEQRLVRRLEANRKPGSGWERRNPLMVIFFLPKLMDLDSV